MEYTTNITTATNNNSNYMSSLLSEVEVMDNTLPYVITNISETDEQKNDKLNENSTTEDEDSSDSKRKIIAPTIEEVDEDPESLRTLRGQGRYFGVVDDEEDGIKEAVPKCSNCSQRGHLKKNCPHVICTYCGAMDDHYSKHCPKAIKCANCNENGHYRSQCPHKWKRVYCTLCNSKKHSRERCPSIWRVYLIRDENKKTGTSLLKKIPFDKIFCYNCGSQGHFGDDCHNKRSSRVPNDDGSAFSGDNLPSKLKRSYYNYVNGLKQNSNNNNHFDFNDYEIDESYYSNNNNSNSNNSKQRKRSSRDNGPVSNKTSRYNNNSNNSFNTNNHPLDFPRSNRYSPNNVLNNMQNSRYNGNSSNISMNNNNNRSRNYKPANYKNYNSFKPFRSGTIRR